MSRTAIYISSVAAMVLAGALCLAHADVYRWVGKDGVVHYSDQWQPGATRIMTDTGTPVASSGAASNAQQGIAAEDRTADSKIAKQNAERAVAATEAQLRTTRCKKAKARYQRLIYARRLYTVDKSGERHYMTDAQDDTARVKAREAVDQFCGSGSGS